MSDGRYPTVSMTRYVLAVLAAMIAIILIVLGLIYAFDITPPTSSGQITTLVSTMIGVMWFSRRVNRPMMNEERLWFATGVTAVNAVVPLLYVIISLLIVGLPISIESVDLFFGDGKGFLLETALAWLMTFILALTFAQAYFFSWLLTRKLPRAAKVA